MCATNVVIKCIIGLTVFPLYVTVPQFHIPGPMILAYPCAVTGCGGDQGLGPLLLFVYIMQWCLHSHNSEDSRLQ